MLHFRSPVRTIFHIDGDAFFAACEQSIHPDWVGRAVVTGKERGIVSAASYEAKARGVSRSTALWDVHKIIPNAIIVSSDYETYSLFSKRMFAIIRRFIPEVEEYSIDEAFVDATGADRTHNCSYVELALRIQSVVKNELGISISIGIGPSKSLAKVGSKWKKPFGVTEITTETRAQYLQHIEIGKIWGIGSAHATRFRMIGIRTAQQFADMPASVMKQTQYKPMKEIWHELNGISINPVVTSLKQDYKSISKMETFTPPSSTTSYLKARIMRNLENACIKARSHDLLASKVSLYLRKQDFHSSYTEAKLSVDSAYPGQIFPVLEELFDSMFEDRVLYRATAVTLMGLVKMTGSQKALFSTYEPDIQQARAYKGIDRLNAKYGKHTVATGASLRLSPLQRQRVRYRINIPVLHVTV